MLPFQTWYTRFAMGHASTPLATDFQTLGWNRVKDLKLEHIHFLLLPQKPTQHQKSQRTKVSVNCQQIHAISEPNARKIAFVIGFFWDFDLEFGEEENFGGGGEGGV